MTDKESSQESNNIELLEQVVTKVLNDYIRLVDDQSTEKNVVLKNIESQLNATIFHDKGMAELTHEFGEEISELINQVKRLEQAQIDGMQQLNRTLVRVEHLIAGDLNIRRMLVDLITDIYERLFNERPKIDVSEDAVYNRSADK